MTRKRTFKLSADLDAAIQHRATALKYNSWAAYVKAALRRDLMTQPDHSEVHAHAQLPPGDQDDLDRWLHALVRNASTGLAFLIAL